MQARREKVHSTFRLRLTVETRARANQKMQRSRRWWAAAYAAWAAAAILVAVRIDRSVSEPYMVSPPLDPLALEPPELTCAPPQDEIFHVPQTEKYCDGQWSDWDPALTTPPGLCVPSPRCTIHSLIRSDSYAKTATCSRLHSLIYGDIYPSWSRSPPTRAPSLHSERPTSSSPSPCPFCTRPSSRSSSSRTRAPTSRDCDNTHGRGL